MGPREKLLMAAVIVAIAFYAFGWNAVYLCGVIALIFLFTRPSRR
jgi:hypothetical protein